MTLDEVYAAIAPQVTLPAWMTSLEDVVQARIHPLPALQLIAGGDLAMSQAFWRRLGPFVKRFPGFCYHAMNRFGAIDLATKSDAFLRGIEAVEALRDSETEEEVTHWKLFLKAGAAVGVQYYEMDVPESAWSAELMTLMLHFRFPPTLAHACLNFFATEMIAAAVCERIDSGAFAIRHRGETRWVKAHRAGVVYHPERSWEHQHLAYKLLILAAEADEGPVPTAEWMRAVLLRVTELFVKLGAL